VYYVHRLVAAAFIGDVEGRQVDHKDRDPLHNSVDNLRIVSASENMRNKTSSKGHVCEYVDTLPDGAIGVDHYGTHQFEGLFYSDGLFYVYNGLKYRILTILHEPRHPDWLYSQVLDADGRAAKISIARFRRSIGEI
jgi:hypothetical protein